MKLYLVRHGETDWNAQRRLQGHADIPLNSKGIAQADYWRPYFAEIHLSGVYSSTLDRAMHTALRATGRPACVLPEFRERDLGDWQGRSWPDLCEEMPDLSERWRNHRTRPPGGESLDDALQRVRPALTAVVEEHPASSAILIVTHGGTGKTIHGALLGMPPREMPAVPSLGNGAISVFSRKDGVWRLDKTIAPDIERTFIPAAEYGG